MSDIIVRSENDLSTVRTFEDAIRQKRKRIQKQKTPPKKVKKKGSFDYVPDAEMFNKLNEEYPIWSWDEAGSQPVIQIMNWIVVSGKLTVIDEGVKRSFFSPGAAQIQIKKGGDPNNFQDVLSISNTVKSANTDGFKKAINRLTGAFSDVYKNEPEEVITDDQKSVIFDYISRAEEIDSRYSLHNIEAIYGDIESMNIKDYNKVISTLKNIIGE